MATRGAPFPRASYWFAAMVAAAAVAFWPIYLSRMSDVRETLVHLHTIGVLSWMVLLITQPLLIQRGRRQLHRRLGSLSYGLVPYILVTAILLAHSRFKAMDDATFAHDGGSLWLPLIAALLFLTCYALAIYHRKDMAVHARFMVASALPLIDPIVARLVIFYTPLPPDALTFTKFGYGLTDLVLLVLIWLDRHERRGRWVFPTLLAIFAAGHIGWFTFGQSQAWLSFATWFRSLPLT